MKDNSRFHITSKQLIFIIIGSTIATGILSLPRVATADAGPDGWIAVLGGAGIPLLSLFLIERLGRSFPNFTIAEMSRLLFGKYLGFAVTLGFVAYLIFIQSVILRVGTEITSMYVLPNTPISVISLLIVLTVIYIAAKGAKVIGRLNELLFYFLLFDLLVILPSLWVGDFTNLLPIGGSGITDIAKGVLPTAFSYEGMEILFVLYPMVTRKDEILKAGITSIGIIAVIYVSVVVTAVLIFGADVLQHIIWPTLPLLKVVEIPVLERLEFFFLIFWMGLISRPVINGCMSGAFSFVQMLNLDGEKYYPYAVTGIGLAVYAASMIPQNIIQVFEFATYGGYAFLAIALGYPVLFHVMLFFRKGKVKKVVQGLLFFFFLFVLVFVPGCWDYTDIDDQSVPIIGIYDLADLPNTEEKGIKVTGIFPVLHPEAEEKSRIDDITGRSVAETREKRNASDPEVLEIGLLQAGIFGEALARKGLQEVTDNLLRDPMCKNTLVVGVMEGNTEEIFKLKIKNYPNPGLYLFELLKDPEKTSFLPTTTLHQFGVQKFGAGKNPIVPLLQIKNNSLVSISGTGIFRKDKLIAKIGLAETRSLLLLRGPESSGHIDYTLEENGKVIDQGSMLVKASRKVKVMRQGNDFTFFITIGIKGKILGHTSTLYFLDTKNTIPFDKIEQVVKNQIERECRSFVEKMQNEFQVDCIDISKYALAKWRKELEDKVEQKSFIKNAKIMIDVKVKVLNVGELT